MYLRFHALLAILLFALPVRAQSGSPLPSSPGISKTLQDILSESVTAPPVSGSRSPARSTTFEPSGETLFIQPMLAKMNLNPAQEAQFRAYAKQTLTMVESVYQANGYPKNDLGVAYGGLLEFCYEISTGTFRPEGADPAAQKKTRAAIEQLRSAIGGASAFRSLSAATKQKDYETATFLIGYLLVTWQQAGKDAAKQSALRDTARQLIQGIYRVEPDRLTRRETGTFQIKGRPVAASPATPIRAARVNLSGAQVFVKYTLRYYPSMTTDFEPLLLFPNGTASDDFSLEPTRDHLGTWKRQGETIVLRFPGQKEVQRTLRRHPKGWADSGDKTPSGSYDIYFPVLPVSKKTLTGGTWKNKELSTMGTAGGAAPMVAAGSTGQILFRPDGTFTTSSERFASATTSNMGDAFRSGGDVGVSSNKKSAESGRWRIDGLLMTRERNDGKRTVQMIFALPNWGKKGETPDLLIDGSRWARSER